MQEGTARLPFLMSHGHLTRYGMLHKIKSCFPLDLYAIIKSYLLQKTFKYREVITQLKDIYSGISQGNMLGPVLYLLYTADLPIALDITATYADDTAILPTPFLAISECRKAFLVNAEMLLYDFCYKSISAFTRKSFLHPDIAKKNGESESMGQNL